MSKYIPTGNERVSLPTISENDGSIEAIGFLYMAQKGMIEVRGDENEPLMRPFVCRKNGNGAFDELSFDEVSFDRRSFWIPVMNASSDGVSLCATYLAPVGERGFGIRLVLKSSSDREFRFGLKGRWSKSVHCVNEEKLLDGIMNCSESHWNESIVFDFCCGFPLFSFAPMADRDIESCFEKSSDGISYELFADCALKAGQEEVLTVYWGIGFEEVAAATSAKEMLRRTWEREYGETVARLDSLISKMPSDRLTRIYNTNLFFCLFFSTGITLDTEELVCATSRSPRYYVSAAYWDRDTLLWTFPAVLDVDLKLAREILLYIFGRQRRNLGIHSRYIDGTVLEPGFELDELMAPVIALASYVERSGDRAILEKERFKEGIDEILEKLFSKKHKSAYLFESFLQPSDDMQKNPYLTYDNMLVWLALNKIAGLYPEKYSCLRDAAEKVKAAIYSDCVAVDREGRPFFAWSVDLEGEHEVYDEPPGSLQLLPYYGFCEPDDEIWLNTVKKIRSPEYEYSFYDQPIAEIGCAHAPYPWLLSLCNSLLSGHDEQAWRELEIMELDNGIACEGVDPVDGSSRTGEAFATCAGFLCHSMKVASERSSCND